MPRLTLSQQVESLQSQLASAQSEVQSSRKMRELLTVDLRESEKRLNHYRNLSEEVPGLKEALAKATQGQNSYKSLWENSGKVIADLNNEREQLHLIIDAVEGAPARFAAKTEDDYGSKGKEREITTRLAGTFIALAKGFALKG